MQHEEPIFFIDRCLGSVVVPRILTEAGARVELHGDHFEDDESDAVILGLVGAKQWVFLSKDARIRRRPAELEALRVANVAAFIASSGNASGVALGSAFAKALNHMKRICGTHDRPIVGTVTLGGAVALICGRRRGGIRWD